MGWWANQKARSDEAKAIRKAEGISAWELAKRRTDEQEQAKRAAGKSTVQSRLEESQAKTAGRMAEIASKRAELAPAAVERTHVWFGMTFQLQGDVITYNRMRGPEIRPVKGVTARIEDSGTIFRKSRMIVEGPDFYWVHEFSPSSSPKAQMFVRAVNTAGKG